MLVRKFATAATAAIVIAAFSVSTTAFAQADQGAAACQPEQGKITAGVAQTGLLGGIISSLAPINELNQQSLFNC